MLRQTQILLWRTLAVLALVLGAIGVVLPVMPTVPFLLLAAWAASRGWPSMERWMLDHAHFGPHIRRWRERRAVPRRAKIFAVSCMSVSAVIIWVAPFPLWVPVIVTVFLAGTAIWLIRRPES